MLIKGVQDMVSNGIAFMKAGDGPYVVGVGPFEELAQAPESGTAFYCNDFTQTPVQFLNGILRRRPGSGGAGSLVCKFTNVWGLGFFSLS